MKVTLISDASYCDRYKVAGYGFWIASQRGKLGGSGAMAQSVENNNTAEMMAICNAIWKGIEKKIICKGDKLLIQSDCLGAMDKMQGKREAVSAQEKSVLAYFVETIHQNDLATEFRHVRGHTQIKEPRYAANRVCDKAAKAQMRLARSKIIAEQTVKELETPNARQ